MKRQSQKAFWGFSNDKVTSMIPPEKLQEYEEAFERICEKCGVNNIDELVSNFI